MRSNQRNEFAGSDDLVCFQNLGNGVDARHKVIGAGRIRAFHEDIVIGIARNLDLAQSGNQVDCFQSAEGTVAAGLCES